MSACTTPDDTTPDAVAGTVGRRRGLATSVMAALGSWAAGRGATSCVLQVVASNAPALALYDRLSFTVHHRYHYRLAADPAAAADGDGAAR